MKLIKCIIILFFFPNIALAKIENKIIVKVQDQIITNYEIKNKILTTLVLNKQEINQYNIDSLKKQILDNLIILKLKKIELTKYNIKKNDRQIQMYLDTISENNLSNLKEKFSQNNLNFELFVADIAIELMWQELIYKIYKSKIQINENEINEELKKLANINSINKEYNLSEIEIFFNDIIKEKEKIENIQNLIQTEKFEEVAKNFSESNSASDGGNIGWVDEKALSAEIYKSIQNLKKGEISKPIQKTKSILFLKINDIRENRIKIENKDELKANIINKKKNKLYNLYSISHLSKLKNSSLIEYK